MHFVCISVVTVYLCVVNIFQCDIVYLCIVNIFLCNYNAFIITLDLCVYDIL